MLLNVDNKLMVNGSADAMTGFPPPIQVENPDLGGGDPETEALAYVNNSTETYDEFAFTDALLRGDVDSIKNYCGRSRATVIAVASGDFNSASTWWNITTDSQAVPGAAANILIPAGIEVTYNQVSSTVYGFIRVDGDWKFADDQNTELHCDTIFIDHTGTYKLATSGSPASSAFTQKVVYHDGGALDVTNDPVKMQRGLISFGQCSIYAAPVIMKRRATGGLSASGTSVTLDAAVTGVSGFRDWKVGDELIIPGTRMRGHSLSSQWDDHEHEVVTITAIDDTTPTAPIITFANDALTYDHPVCWKRSGWTAHVVNRTRNFQTWTESPANNQRRAHQLFKNKDQNTIQYVEAWAMGRTDMDYRTLGTSPVKLGSQTLTSDTNTNGRYTWHFHRNGAKDTTLNPSVFRGCVGYDSPGWVFVHHDSHGHMYDCLAYDFQAVGFAGEGGGSWGEIDGCVAIGSRRTWRSATVSSIKNGGHSIGDIGHGFWTNSRPLNIKNCVAANCTVGFAWTSRVDFGTDVFPAVVAEPVSLYGKIADPDVTVSKAVVVIEGFENNEAYACNWGGSIAKKLPSQHHDLVSFLDGFKAWEVDQGFHWQYTGMYSVKDFELIGFNPAYRDKNPFNATIGMQPFRQTIAMSFIEPIIEEFNRGIMFTLVDGPGMDENKQHIVVEPTFVNCDDNYTNGGTGITLPWTPGANGYNSAVEIALASVGNSAAGQITTGYPEDASYFDGGQGVQFVIANGHTYTDSLGPTTRYRAVPNPNTYPSWPTLIDDQETAKLSSTSSKDGGVYTLISRTQIHLLMQQEGVWDSVGGDKVLLMPDVIQDRFSGNSTYFYTPVALRIPQSQYDSVNPTENGNLGIHVNDSGVSQDFTNFNPAGTKGLT